MLDPVAFAVGDCKEPVAGRLSVGEALADEGQLPAGGWPPWVQPLMVPVAAILAQAQAPTSQLWPPALVLLPNLLLQFVFSFAPASS